MPQDAVWPQGASMTNRLNNSVLKDLNWWTKWNEMLCKGGKIPWQLEVFQTESATFWEVVPGARMWGEGLGGTCQRGWTLSRQALSCHPNLSFMRLNVRQDGGRQRGKEGEEDLFTIFCMEAEWQDHHSSHCHSWNCRVWIRRRDTARAHRRCYLHSETRILRERWQISASH